MLRALFLLAFAVAAGCSTPTTNDDAGAADMAGPALDSALSVDAAGGACDPACAGATPHCNGSGHCVGCLADGDCPLGTSCKVVSDAVATCVAGCTDDSRCAGDNHCCSGACVDWTSDGNHCGSCSSACMTAHDSPSCVAGKCTSGACEAGFADCNDDASDGCETNIMTDPQNCTGCGMACSIPNAVAACANACYITACVYGFGDCDQDPSNGCEMSVLADPSNCGACGNTCGAIPHAATVCSNGACLLGDCSPGWADCDGDPKNGCEVAIGSDASNCGACGQVCGNGLGCFAGNCVNANLAQLDANLIGYWKFDDGKGQSALDSSPSSNNGALHGAASWVAGKLGNALSLDGNTGFVQTAQPVEVAVTAYTVSAWFQTASSKDQVLFANRGVTGSAGKSLTLNMGHSGKGGHLVWLLDLDGWGLGIASNNTYNDGQWHHVVATWAAGQGTPVAFGQFLLYVDGAAVATSNYTINFAGNQPSPLSGSEAAQIGTSIPWAGTEFTGTLDEVGVWNRALPLSDVVAIYNNGNGLSLP